ncbi:Dabb family protein [Bacillus sp. UNC438CL73TsuS30]|uniref:Dabb family protein n=1 Tax=Bacillus sp. UNC438CL73TsuS30 TaxID=1340434 RepID=UPI00047C3585|nr:Dabb family protein [Bacillus sp. UNC438CL73TsuS30]
MVEHIVLLKFSELTTREQKDDAIRMTLALKDEIPGIIDIQQGYNFSERNKGYEVGLTVRFDHRHSLENYGPHSKHQEVFTFLKEIGLEDLIVIDFEL